MQSQEELIPVLNELGETLHYQDYSDNQLRHARFAVNPSLPVWLRDRRDVERLQQILCIKEHGRSYEVEATENNLLHLIPVKNNGGEWIQ